MKMDQIFIKKHQSNSQKNGHKRIHTVNMLNNIKLIKSNERRKEKKKNTEKLLLFDVALHCSKIRKYP